MLCRLNHELLPDPGNPIASTTVPLLARAGATGTSPGAGVAGKFAATADAGADDSNVVDAADDSAAATGAAAPAGRRDPPRPPRLRRRRVVRGRGATDPAVAAGAETVSGSCAASVATREDRRDSATGASTGLSARTAGGAAGSSS